jgi:hypothetical protein
MMMIRGILPGVESPGRVLAGIGEAALAAAGLQAAHSCRRQDSERAMTRGLHGVEKIITDIDVFVANGVV